MTSQGQDDVVPQLLTLPEVAERLRCSVRSVRRMLTDPDRPLRSTTVTTGRRGLRVAERDLIEWISTELNRPAPQPAERRSQPAPPVTRRRPPPSRPTGRGVLSAPRRVDG